MLGVSKGGARLIHDLVRRAGTQRAVAKRVGISQPFLSQVLHGHRTPGLAVLVRLLDVTEASYDEREAVLAECAARAGGRRQSAPAERDAARDATRGAA